MRDHLIHPVIQTLQDDQLCLTGVKASGLSQTTRHVVAKPRQKDCKTFLEDDSSRGNLYLKESC